MKLQKKILRVLSDREMSFVQGGTHNGKNPPEMMQRLLEFPR
ncbi:hypothetical protein [Pseudoalteromonas umbrosa]|nr:hypothetical protein [Pseudoalteromonas sp. B95]MDK1289713.1 hypothetical protein [Pseudoalteromonas sp. B95]